MALKKRWLDILAALLVVALFATFYWPEVEPATQSRYAWYSDGFERVATLLNPDYTNEFHVLHMETQGPLITLVSWASLRTFMPDVETAFFFYIISFLTFAVTMTHWAIRRFYATIPALFLSVFILCDRTLMPVSRGIGIMNVLLLIPAMLLFLRHLAYSQNRALPIQKRLRSALIMALNLALMFWLGGHEIFFAIFTLFGFCGLLALEWLWLRLARRGKPSGPTDTTCFAVGLGLILVVIFFLSVRALVDPQQNRYSLKETFTLGQAGERGMDKIALKFKDMQAEGKTGLRWELYFRKRVFESTFIEGKTLSIAPGVLPSRFHEHTYLYPGAGFNGIVPLFALPGFLLGLMLFLREWMAYLRSLRTGSPGPIRIRKYLLLLYLILLMSFIGQFLVSVDSKPSDRTFGILAILALTAEGYTWLIHIISRFARHLLRAKMPSLSGTRCVGSLVSMILVILPLLIFSSLRITKNYRDLQDYFRAYADQIITKDYAPIFRLATDVLPNKQIHIIDLYHEMRSETGLLFNYSLPDNLHLHRTFDAAKPIDPDGLYYYIPNFFFPDVDQRDGAPRAFTGAEILANPPIL